MIRRLLLTAVAEGLVSETLQLWELFRLIYIVCKINIICVNGECEMLEIYTYFIFMQCSFK